MKLTAEQKVVLFDHASNMCKVFCYSDEYFVIGEKLKELIVPFAIQSIGRTKLNKVRIIIEELDNFTHHVLLSKSSRGKVIDLDVCLDSELGKLAVRHKELFLEGSLLHVNRLADYHYLIAMCDNYEDLCFFWSYARILRGKFKCELTDGQVVNKSLASTIPNELLARVIQDERVIISKSSKEVT